MSKKFVWHNTDNGAVLQTENTPTDYECVFESEDRAIEWLEDFLARPDIDESQDMGHIELKELRPAESHRNGEDVRKALEA